MRNILEKKNKQKTQQTCIEWRNRKPTKPWQKNPRNKIKIKIKRIKLKNIIYDKLEMRITFKVNKYFPKKTKKKLGI